METHTYRECGSNSPVPKVINSPAQKVINNPAHASKKAEAKKRKSPRTPIREKDKGKENRPARVSQQGLSRVRGRATRAYARRGVDAALDEAVAAFGGTGSDRRIWARIAWRVGYGNFLDAVFQARSEIRAKRGTATSAPRGAAETFVARPAPQGRNGSSAARIFQSVLNARFPKGGAR